MDPRLADVINKIRDESLRRIVLEVVKEPSLNLGGTVYKGLRLEDSPASLSRHHSYPGGLLEHILSTVRIALTLCDCVEEVYHGRVNRDLVISGVILHDIFKTLTYVAKEGGGYEPSPVSERIDHLTLIASELVRRGLPLDIVHVVCAHHGDAGPMSPKTLEALICHVADVADSILNGKVLKAAKYLIREATGKSVEVMDSETAFKIVQLKAREGWNGVRRAVADSTMMDE
ncbi:MAG: hypothetical protein AYL32_004090 [Candidatus Bathyarchaeota archaeon B26-2]|nr:MAG: hypothetical protein AYL32_004090 [Candidatus Bathyarchaeota archaeon B26-2]